jgi:hypothetical protein
MFCVYDMGPLAAIAFRLVQRTEYCPANALPACRAGRHANARTGVALYLNRFFRTFGAASKPLRSANPLSIRE